MKRATLSIVLGVVLVLSLALVGCGEPAVAKHTVTFDYDYDYLVESTIVEDGANISEPTAREREGYIFNGWTLAGEIYDFATPVTRDITLKASWSKLKSVNVKLGKNSIEVSLRDKPSYTLDDFKKVALDGAYLVGFYDIVDGKRVYKDISNGLDEGITMYADFASLGVVLGEIEGKDEAEIVAYNGESTKILLPHFYNGKPITTIGENAFNKKTIEALNFPEYTHTIGKGAFSETTMQNIGIPASVKVIKEYAFANSHIANIGFVAGSKIESIEPYAFTFVYELKSIRLPDGLTKLSHDTFFMCENLERAYVPNSVTTLENYIFRGCLNMKSIQRQNLIEGADYIEGLQWNYISDKGSVGSTIDVPVTKVDDDSTF